MGARADALRTLLEQGDIMDRADADAYAVIAATLEVIESAADADTPAVGSADTAFEVVLSVLGDEISTSPMPMLRMIAVVLHVAALAAALAEALAEHTDEYGTSSRQVIQGLARSAAHDWTFG